MPPNVQFDENSDLGPVYRSPSVGKFESSPKGVAGLFARITGVRDPRTINLIMITTIVIFFGVSIYFLFFKNRAPAAGSVPGAVPDIPAGPTTEFGI